jgi:hypothetical protein
MTRNNTLIFDSATARGPRPPLKAARQHHQALAPACCTERTETEAATHRGHGPMKLCCNELGQQTQFKTYLASDHSTSEARATLPNPVFQNVLADGRMTHKSRIQFSATELGFRPAFTNNSVRDKMDHIEGRLPGDPPNSARAGQIS